MIHYHGTPISGPKEDAYKFLRGRHALVPFFRPFNLATVADVCQSFIFDNSAFTIWKKGGKLNIYEYMTWVDSWSKHPGLDWALIPDIIDGSEKDNDNMILAWHKNNMKCLGVPVYHLHESLERLELLVRNYPLIALGSSGRWKTPGTTDWWWRMNEMMRVLCDDHGRPKCKLHGLRMLNSSIIERLPLSSADSTNAGVNAGAKNRFGYYPAPSAAERANAIADRIELVNSPAVYTFL